MTWKGIDLTALLGTLASIITALLGWLATSIKKKQEAQAAQSKAETAILKLSAIAAGMAMRAWGTLSPVAQAGFADGKWGPEDQSTFEKAVAALVKDFCSDDDLKQIAEALGLPLPGIIAKLAAMLIEKFAFAHDPATPQGSDLAFPVSAPDPRTDPAYVGG